MSGDTTQNCSPTTTMIDGDQSPIELDFLKKISSDSEVAFPYQGLGTKQAPFIVTFLEGDTGNPYNFSTRKKWIILSVVSMLTLCIAFGSSVYAGGIFAMERYFDASTESLTLGLSLYVSTIT